MNTIAKLRELEAKAQCPQRWRACTVNREEAGVCSCRSVFGKDEGIVCTVSASGMGGPVDIEAHALNDAGKTGRERMAALMDLIAETHNALPALLAIAEAAEKLRHIQATRDYDDAESAASGLTFSIGDLSNAKAELDTALAKLEEVEL